jgi:hypothetical protein
MRSYAKERDAQGGHLSFTYLKYVGRLCLKMPGILIEK